MQSSTAVRKKLLSGYHLLLIAALFAAAFAVLLPSESQFRYEQSQNPASDGDSVDALELAYLRARMAAGEHSSDELNNAVARLIETGMYQQATTLTREQPGIELADSARFRLELEQVIAAYQQRDSAPDQTLPDARQLLLEKLHFLLATPSLHDGDILQRAATVSQWLDQPSLSASLYAALAASDQQQRAHWFEQCGIHALTAGNQSRAGECYAQAVQSSSAEKAFALRIVQLRHLSADWPPEQTQTLIGQLLAHDPVSATELEELASALLASERPADAVKAYTRLAQIDPAREAHWLDSAARWAVASNQTILATEILADMRELVPAEETAPIDQQIEHLLLASGEQQTLIERLRNRIALNPEDGDALRDGLALALQLGETRQAIEWNTRLLLLEPLNAAFLHRQIELFLAVNELQKATHWARQTVAAHAEDSQARAQLARLLEWTGDPVAALHQWQSAYQISPELSSLDHIVRLSRMTLQPGIAAELLLQRIAFEEPDEGDLQQLVKLQELLGRPDVAADAIELVIRLYGATGARFKRLAQLHKRHNALAQSLATWSRHDKALGSADESLLNQIELHWRLNQPARAAQLSNRLLGKPLPAVATDYQIRVLSEIAWRYEQSELMLLAGARLQQIVTDNEDIENGKRLLQVMQDTGQYNDAVIEAERLWQQNGRVEFALAAMDIRFRRGDREYPQAYSVPGARTTALHHTADYWNQQASMHLRNRQSEQAEQAYRQALSIEADNNHALSGLLWLFIGNGDKDRIREVLSTWKEPSATQLPLWSAYAVASLHSGDVAGSLRWFSRLGDSIDADYSILLLYSDALELAGEAEKALQLRRYTLQQLRPMLADESAADHDLLLRQYSRLLSAYGSADEREQLSRYLLSAGNKDTDNTDFWREDLAISWLMSTERHEHARVIMSRIHQQRLGTPAWQQMALALKSGNQQAVQSILDHGGPLSGGDRVLALRALGRQAQARSLAQQLNHSASTVAERQLAAEQYASMRASGPGYAGSSVNNISAGELSIREFGLSARHTFAPSGTGVAVEYVRRRLESGRYDLGDLEQQSDVAVSLHYANTHRGGNISTGFVSRSDADHVYIDGLYFQTSHDGRRSISAEFAYNESASQSTPLRIAGKQHRLSLGVDVGFGKTEFYKVQLDASEIKTLVGDKKVARGIQARVEIGFRGSIGGKYWSTSVAADNRSFDPVDALPAELRLDSGLTMDSVLAEQASSLSIGASLARGDVNATFPQSSAPRYYLNTRLGHTWPDDSFGLQLDAGAGIRLLGGDELSFGLSYEVHSAKPQTGDSDSTSLGINYRYHF